VLDAAKNVTVVGDEEIAVLHNSTKREETGKALKKGREGSRWNEHFMDGGKKNGNGSSPLIRLRRKGGRGLTYGY